MQTEMLTKVKSRIERIDQNELEALSDKELDQCYRSVWDDVQAGIEWTARKLELVAVYRAEYRRRGRPLPKLPGRLDYWLEEIAAGRLDAEAYRRFVSKPTLLRALVGMPRHEQKLFAKGKTVTVLRTAANGTENGTEVPIEDLSRDEVFQVFSGHDVRDEAEQAEYLGKRQQATLTATPAVQTITIAFTATEYQRLVTEAKQEHCRVVTLIKRRALSA